MNNSNPDHIRTRTREFSWEDPMAGAIKALSMDGLDYLKEIETGTIPPPPIGLLMDCH